MSEKGKFIMKRNDIDNEIIEIYHREQNWLITMMHIDALALFFGNSYKAELNMEEDNEWDIDVIIKAHM